MTNILELTQLKILNPGNIENYYQGCVLHYLIVSFAALLKRIIVYLFVGTFSKFFCRCIAILKENILKNMQ